MGKSQLRVNVVLEEDVSTLSSVQILAKRQKKKNIQSLSPDRLNAQVGPAGAIESLVGTFSGVVQKNELSNQYNVRGGSFDENLVYINGVEIYRPLLARSAEQEGLSTINPDLVSQVDFSSGGFAVNYGDKLSSVLDIRYRKPKRTEASVLAGLLNSRLHFGTRYKDLSFIAGARIKRVASLLSTLDTKGAYDPIYMDFQSALNYSFNRNWKISLLNHVKQTDYRFRPISRKTTFGTLKQQKQLDIAFDGKEDDRFTTYLSALNLDFIPNSHSRHQLNLSAFYSQEQERYDLASEYLLAGTNSPKVEEQPDFNKAQMEDYDKLGLGRSRSHARNRIDYFALSLRTNSQHAFTQKYRLKYGLELKLNKVQDYTDEWTMRDSLSYTTPLDPKSLMVDSRRSGVQDLQTLSLASFVEGRANYQADTWGNFTTSLGLRASYFSWNRELVFSPRFHLFFQPKRYQDLSYHFTTGLYYQCPTYLEMLQEKLIGMRDYQLGLNPEIKSQSAGLALLGADYDFKLLGRRFKFSAEAFAKYLWNMNPYKQENIKIKYLGRNNARAYVVGLDTKLYGEFVKGEDSWLSLSLIHGRQSIDKKPYNLPLVNAPLLSASLFFQDYFPYYKPIRLSLRAVYSTGLPVMHAGRDYDRIAFQSSAYKRVDLGLVYRISDNPSGESYAWAKGRYSLDLIFELFNLFDMSNVSSYFWIRDVYNVSYAVPNYLTRRSWNVSLKFSFH